MITVKQTKRKKKEEGRLGVFDRGNGPTGSCIQRDRVVVCAVSWRFLFFCPFFFGWRAMLKWGKVGGGGGGGGGESSVVGVGVIVGDGAEKESVLRPGCWPSGEKLFQRRLKWSGPRSTLRREKCCARVSFIYFVFGRAIRASAEFFRGLMKTKNGVTVTFDFWVHILGVQARQKLLRKADCYFYIFFNTWTVNKTVSSSVLCNYDQNKPFDTSNVSVYAANCRGSCSSFIHRVGMQSHWTFVSSLAANHIFFFW